MTHVHDEIDELKAQLLDLGETVYTHMEKSFKALTTNDLNLAEEAIKEDKDIDERELCIEEACLRVLALYSPVASDLRLIISLIKINADLERISDYGVNLCRYIKKIAALENGSEIEISPKFDEITKASLEMFRKSLESLKTLDIELAVEVCEMDDIVDDLNKEILSKIQRKIIKKPDLCQGYLFLHSASRSIERLSDYTTHIAEDVYYLQTGKIVRHHNEEMND